MTGQEWDRLKFVTSLLAAVFVFLNAVLELRRDPDDPDDDE